jgi:hypothetical protein
MMYSIYQLKVLIGELKALLRINVNTLFNLVS